MEEDIPVPKRVLQAIPKPKKQRGAYAKLIFNANRILEKVQGIAGSMGGILENLTDFTVEVLAPDTDFLVETRGATPPITDYRTQYQDMEVIFSTLPNLDKPEPKRKNLGHGIGTDTELKF